MRVHESILEAQKLPRKVVSKKRIWQERFEDIAAFERYFARQGFVILKFFLHVSKKEQKERFLERLDRPEKNWKFSRADIGEREHWGAYQQAYQDVIRHTAAPHAPWFVVPADRKWFTRLVVAAAIHDALDRLNLAYPTVSDEKKEELAACRVELAGSRTPPPADRRPAPRRVAPIAGFERAAPLEEHALPRRSAHSSLDAADGQATSGTSSGRCRAWSRRSR